MNLKKSKSTPNKKFIWKFIFLLIVYSKSYGQDTIILKETPKVILHSWYPEHKPSPKYKKGESKIIMTLTPNLDSTKLRNCIIELRPKNEFVDIKPTGKIYPSQFVVTVNKTNQKSAEFEVWLLVDNKVVLVNNNGNLVNIKDLFLTKENKVKIETIKVDLVNCRFSKLKYNG